MPISTFTIILGVVSYVMGFPLVFSDAKVTTWRKQVLKDETAVRVTGIVFAVISILVLKTQWKFTPDVEGVMVVIAWFMIAKSLFMAWWPDQYSQIKLKNEKKWFKTHVSHMSLGVVQIAVGAFFTYLGLILA